MAGEEPRMPWGPGKSTLLPTRRRRTTQRDINQYPSPSSSTYTRVSEGRDNSNNNCANRCSFGGRFNHIGNMTSYYFGKMSLGGGR